MTSILAATRDNATVEEIKALIETGGNILEEDDNSRTSLHLAASLGRIDVIDLLLESLKQKGEPVDKFVNLQDIKVKFSSNNANAKGKSLLHHSAQAGHIELSKNLIQKGATINEKNIGGQTALHYASHRGDLELVKFLLAHSAKVNDTNVYGQTALHYASQEGHTEVVKVLIESGGRVNALTSDHHTPLHFAVAHGHYSTVQMLLNSKAIVSSSIQELETTSDIEQLLEDAVTDPSFKELMQKEGKMNKWKDKKLTVEIPKPSATPQVLLTPQTPLESNSKDFSFPLKEDV